MKDFIIRRKSQFYSSAYFPKTIASKQSKYRLLALFKSKTFLIILILSVIALYVNLKSFSKTDQPKPAIKGASLTLPDINSIKPAAKPVLKSNAPSLNITAKSALLIDPESGYMLYGKNENLQVAVASITKILTAIIVVENYDLNKTITINKNDILVEGAKVGLRINEKISVLNLLKGMLIVSGNDAAYSLASHWPDIESDSSKLFVKKMNEKARLLGLINSKFSDAAGLEDSGYSTAHDIAFIASYALKNKVIADIVQTAQADISSTDGKIVHKLQNTNRLVRSDQSLFYTSAIGVKTGYTRDAGHSLLSAAKQNNHVLICVVLNTNNPSKDESARLSRDLLMWGFENYNW